ncbi:hypothetical protein TcasGA2_TC001838 [Tribolium castaneum]|uniref:DUF5641 domain-containing protein n=1 Tax=Tribolium castaneum TaxID=7070 RepID=D7EJ71_TRICA|nr:hypothetical protein TcasGA2_TC001838 [Tribolium castaneum]
MKQNRLKRFQLVQQLNQYFWSIWSKEYLHLLQTRAKWQMSSDNECPIETIVLLKESTPPLLWKMGSVIEIHPGSDGVVRVVTVKTSSGVLKRPVTKLVPLIRESSPQ